MHRADPASRHRDAAARCAWRTSAPGATPPILPPKSFASATRSTTGRCGSGRLINRSLKNYRRRPRSRLACRRAQRSIRERDRGTAARPALRLASRSRRTAPLHHGDGVGERAARRARCGCRRAWPSGAQGRRGPSADEADVPAAQSRARAKTPVASTGTTVRNSANGSACIAAVIVEVERAIVPSVATAFRR